MTTPDKLKQRLENQRQAVLRSWLNCEFHNALRDEERMLEAMAVLKVGHDRGDLAIDVCRAMIAAFVGELIEPGKFDPPKPVHPT